LPVGGLIKTFSGELMSVKTVTENRGIGIVETRYYTFAQPPSELVLENGEKL